MKPIICLTPFLKSGKKLKLESGESYDDLAINQQRPQKTDKCKSVEKVDNKETDKTWDSIIKVLAKFYLFCKRVTRHSHLKKSCLKHLKNSGASKAWRLQDVVSPRKEWGRNSTLVRDKFEAKGLLFPCPNRFYAILGKVITFSPIFRLRISRRSPSNRQASCCSGISVWCW